MKKIALLLFCLIPWAAHAQNYLWPTEASHYLTSTFGEYRTRHFHSALDIKTWNRKGYKVFAVDDGYIWRIRTSNTGYGKVLYQKLSDGNIAVYAHLDRFQPEIEEFAYQLQDKQGAYELDYFPSPSQFPVKKGQVIAYTGNTGTLYAHLHFEIRNARNEPLNPLSQGYSIKDHIPPTPQAVAVAPLSAHSTVDGDYFKQILSVDYVGNHTYRAEPVVVSGPFGLELRAYDGVHDVNNKYSIYSAAVNWQDSTLFTFRYNRFRFSQTTLITLERDYGLERYGYGRFQRLYKTRYTAKLPFYDDHLDGKITLPPGEHTLRLALRDYNGNESDLIIPVTSVRRYPAVRWEQSARGEIVCKVTPADSAMLPHLHLKAVTEDGASQAVQPETYRIAGESLRLALPALTGGSSAYTLRFGSPEPETGTIYPFSPQPAQNFNPDMNWVFSSQGMIATLTNQEAVYRPLSLEVITADSDTLIPFHSQDLKRWNTPPIPAAMIKNAALFVSSGSDLLAFFPHDYMVAFPAEENILSSPDQNMELAMNRTSLFYPALIWYQTRPAPSGNFHSPIWNFAPRTVPLRNPAKIRVTLPAVPFPRRQLGIYFKGNGRGWKYLPSDFSADSTMLSGDIYSLEAFTLRRDSIPPVIHLLSPRPGGTYQTASLSKLRYRIYDGQSTIPDVRGIQIFLDDQPAIFGYNPNTNIVTYRLRNPLSAGNHSIRVVARDAAGNTTRRSYDFTVR